jgi:hypothetical protein
MLSVGSVTLATPLANGALDFAVLVKNTLV